MWKVFAATLTTIAPKGNTLTSNKCLFDFKTTERDRFDLTNRDDVSLITYNTHSYCLLSRCISSEALLRCWLRDKHFFIVHFIKTLILLHTFFWNPQIYITDQTQETFNTSIFIHLFSTYIHIILFNNFNVLIPAYIEYSIPLHNWTHWIRLWKPFDMKFHIPRLVLIKDFIY